MGDVEVVVGDAEEVVSERGLWEMLVCEEVG